MPHVVLLSSLIIKIIFEIASEPPESQCLYDCLVFDITARAFIDVKKIYNLRQPT